MKKYIWTLLVFLLLAGCAAQPSDPTPAVEVAAPPVVIKPTGFTLNRTDISFFNPGEIFDMKVRLVPKEAEAEVVWTSSDPNIASVSWNGKVIAISGGTVTITAAIEGVGEQQCIVRCQFTGSPTPAPTSVGIEVDIGDGEHIFWVELVGAEQGGSYEINIYQKNGDAQPFQTLEGRCESDFQYLRWGMEDMDFDGYMDLRVLYSVAPNGHASFSYYIWDEKMLKFVPDPYGLNELCSLGTPDMLPEEKAIRTFMRGRAGFEGEIYFYRYLKEGFTCVRQMFWYWHEDEKGADFLVENYENGKMRTVYQETLTAEDLNYYLWSDEFSAWYDPSYPSPSS